MTSPALPSPVDTNSSGIYSPPAQNNGFPSAAATAAAALSEHDATSPNASAGNGRKRKTAAVPGSRGVANLTPEQLQKKRQNDREAQRAIRERTKNTIENLQRRIKELEGQQPFQDYQRVVQERDRALAECEQLRSKLAVVQSVVAGTTPPANPPPSQPQPNLHELATLTAQQTPLPPLSAPSTPQYPAHAGPTSAYDPQPQHIHPELRSPSIASFGTPMSTSATSEPAYPLGQSSAVHYATSNGILYDQRLPPPTAHSNGERLGLNFVLEPKKSSSSTSSPAPALQSFSPSPAIEKPLYARLTRLIPSAPGENALDDILLKFVQDRREQIANGVPLRDVIGPDVPTFDGLRDPGGPQRADSHPISLLLTSILYQFPDISGLPNRVAVHYLMFSIIRWQICPCEPCYERIPPFLRPIKEQHEVPHAAWIDHLQWPSMRYQLITGPTVNFQDFFIPFTSKVSVNWPYHADQVLISAERPDDPSRLNPVFEEHLRDIRNWSVGAAFPAAFPHLCDQTVRIQD